VLLAELGRRSADVIDVVFPGRRRSDSRDRGPDSRRACRAARCAPGRSRRAISRDLLPLQLIARERFNVFYGDNGQGKTDLLEAIFVIASLHSFRTANCKLCSASKLKHPRIAQSSFISRVQ
jgi:AAA15 family ATPase/GTPase